MAAATKAWSVGDRHNATERTRTETIQHAWQSPHPEVIKINVDVSVSPRSSCAKVVGSDSTGRVLLISAQPVNSIETLIVEAEAILLGLRLAVDKAGECCVVTSDVNVIVQCINNTSSLIPWRAGQIINECWHILQFHAHLGLEFCIMSTNIATHKIGHRCLSTDLYGNWGYRNIPSQLAEELCITVNNNCFI